MGTGPEGFYGPSDAQIVSENATTLVYGIGHPGNSRRLLVVEVFGRIHSFIHGVSASFIWRILAASCSPGVPDECLATKSALLCFGSLGFLFGWRRQRLRYRLP
jgi:hypothetical protein